MSKKASSPDELALINFASYCSFLYLGVFDKIVKI